MSFEKTISRVKYILKVLLGREIYVKKGINVKVKWYGNRNAGFYAIPELINENSIVYSFGIGEDVSFDQELIENFNCKVFAFDPTPKAIQFVESQSNLSDKFILKKYGIYNYDGNIEFDLPTNSEHVSCRVHDLNPNSKSKKISVPVKKFTTLIQELGHSKVDVLKMDIEGSEYVVLDDILNSGVEISQILIEFHHRFSGLSTGNTKDAIKKLNSFGYEIAAISNQYEEYSFVKKKIFQSRNI